MVVLLLLGVVAVCGVVDWFVWRDFLRGLLSTEERCLLALGVERARRRRHESVRAWTNRLVGCDD